MAESAARLLQVLTLLQTKPRWTGPELAERLSVTERTLRRDIGRLRDLGYPVLADRGVTGGYRLGAGRALPPLLLDDDEATAIAIALRTVAGSGVTGIAQPALSALTKLEQVLPSRLRPRIETVQQAMLSLPRMTATASPDTLTALATSCRRQHRVRFAYTDHHGRATARHVEPHRLVYSGRYWYLVARDVDRAAWRAFRADRISEPFDTAVRFTPQDPPDATAFVATAVTSAPYAYRARIRLAMPAAEAAHHFPPTAGIVEADGPDGSVLTSGSDSLDAIAVHLVALDVDFTVLEPPELRDRIRTLADRLHRAATTN
jgi:predicted DNA-binding transcriptional regulator YafY